MKKIIVYILLCVSVNAIAQKNTTCLETNHFYFKNYKDEPHFHESKYFEPAYGSSYLPDPQKFFDSLKVISFEKAVAIACNIRKARVNLVKLVYCHADYKKSYWEIEIEGNSWPAYKAPLRYRLTTPGWANGIGYNKIAKIDAVTGKVLKVYKEKYRFIWHF